MTITQSRSGTARPTIDSAMPTETTAPRPTAAGVSTLGDRRNNSPAAPEVMRVNGCDVTIVRTSDASTLSWPDLSLVVIIGGANTEAGERPSVANPVPTERNAVVVNIAMPSGDPDGQSLAIADVPSLIHHVLEDVTTTLRDRMSPMSVSATAHYAAYDARAAHLLGRLTSKERQILERLMDGMTAQQLADDLYISLPTVRGHIQAIFQKLQVATQLAAVVMAYKAGWKAEGWVAKAEE